MKPGILIVAMLMVVLTGMFAPVAWAGSSTTTQIIHDAADGRVDGHYTAAQVRAALRVVNSDPTYSQYSDIAGVLQAYLSSFTASTSSPTAASATSSAATASGSVGRRASQLDYTGGQPFVAFALGGAMLIAGLAVRLRWA